LKKWKFSFAVALFYVIALSLSAFAAPKEPVEILKGTNGKVVKVIHKESVRVSDSKLTSILSDAKEAITEEKSKIAQSQSGDIDKGTTYDYFTFDDNYSYLYEESALSEPELIVYNVNKQTIVNPCNSFEPMAGQTDFIKDGVGGKQKVTKTGSAGSYLSTQMTLPTSAQVSSNLAVHTPYNYGGFEYISTNPNGVGSWASDLGLQLYNNLGPKGTAWGWKPIFILKQKISATDWTDYASIFPDSDHKEGQYRNGYKPGTAPIMYFWYNNNGKVRMKVDGTTICPTRHGEELSDTHNITIMESNASWNISQITNWKLLSTVLSTNNTGKNRAVFSNVKVDGVAVPNAYFPTPEQDHASVTRSSNNVTIVVDSSVYQL
jgi:hypothetical protein